MNNMQAVAYASIAVEELQKDGIKIDYGTLGHKMLSLMDEYSEEEIYEKYMRE